VKADLITLLNAKTSSWTSTGGFDGLTPQQIGQALAGLKGGAYLYAYARHGDNEARRELEKELEKSISVDPKLARIVSLIAVHEEIGDTKCQVCEGRGFIYRGIESPEEAVKANDEGMLTIPCASNQCVEGSYRMTPEEKGRIIAEELGEEYTRFKWRQWAWDYSAALSQLADWHNELEYHLQRKLQDD